MKVNIKDGLNNPYEVVDTKTTYKIYLPNDNCYIWLDEKDLKENLTAAEYEIELITLRHYTIKYVIINTVR